MSSPMLSAVYNGLSPEMARQLDNDEIKTLCLNWKATKNRDAQAQITASYLPLCIKIGNQFAQKYRLDEDTHTDLESQLSAALVETIDRYDPEQQNLFYTYLASRLKGTAEDFMKKQLGLDSTQSRYLFYNLPKLKKQFTEENPDITRSELEQKIIESVRANQQLIVTAYDIGAAEMSIRACGKVETVEDDFLLDTGMSVFGAGIGKPHELVEDEEQQSFRNSFVTLASQHLDQIGWYIIEQAVLKDDPLDIKELALKLGMSHSKVSEILDDSLAKLKELFPEFESEYDPGTHMTLAVPEEERPKAKVEYRGYLTNILVCAILHRDNTGEWPQAVSGEVRWGPLEGQKWAAINSDFRRGNIPDADTSSLAKYLAPFKGMEGLTVEQVLEEATVYNEKSLSVEMIIEGAKLHFKEIGRWPSCHDYSQIEVGSLKEESWGTIDKHLRDGGRGLLGGTSLYQLLKKNGLTYHITPEIVLIAANLHKKETGKWPSSSDTTMIKKGPLKGRNWKSIDTAFARGYFELPSNTTLSRFLKEHGCCDDNTINPENIIKAANLHKKEAGKWPSCKDNRVIERGPLKGEKWSSIHTAIRDGHRGFSPKKGGLPTFLKENDCYDRPVTKIDVLISTLFYKVGHPEGKWPNNKLKEPINDGTILSGKTWPAIDKRQIDGLSLFQIIKEYEANPEYYNALLAAEERVEDLENEFSFDDLDRLELGDEHAISWENYLSEKEEGAFDSDDDQTYEGFAQELDGPYYR